MPMRRKQIRLKEYNYSQAGYYYVTICTKNKQSFLSEIVGVGFHADPYVKLTTIGQEVMKSIVLSRIIIHM